MSALQRGLQRLLTADAVKSTLTGAAASTTVLNIPVGDMAKLYVDAHLLVVSGSSPTVANNLKVVRVWAIDATAHQVTIEPALPVAPAADDELRLGVSLWLASSDALRYERPVFSAPVEDLGDQAAVSGVVVLYGEQRNRSLVCDANESTWEIRAISKSMRHAEGCAERIRTLLEGQRSALQAQVHGAIIGPVQVSDLEQSQREDKLYEFVARVETTLASKVA